MKYPPIEKPKRRQIPKMLAAETMFRFSLAVMTRSSYVCLSTLPDNGVPVGIKSQPLQYFPDHKAKRIKDHL
jgi:hypothetical protein